MNLVKKDYVKKLLWQEFLEVSSMHLSLKQQKVIENTQRDVNIALINELSLIFNDELGY